MKKDIAITKAVDLIMDNVKERAKAKKKLMQKSLQKNKIFESRFDGLAQKPIF